MKLRNLLLIAAAALVVLSGTLSIVPGFRFSIIVCLALAAFLVLVYFLLRFPTPFRRKLLKILLVLALAGSLAAAVTGGFIVSAAHPADEPPCEYIIVLGAGVNGTVPSLTLSERINGAYTYLTANPETVAVLTGGQGPRESITEAACMFRELTRKGIDPSRLILEDRATNTIENLRYSIALLEKEAGSCPTRVGIVSSEYHLFRAKCFARNLGLDPVGIPAKTSWFTLRLNYYLREIVAVWKYLLLGP